MKNETAPDNALTERLRAMLVERFELDPASITPDARLYEDLGLDSIDAVDLALSTEEFTGKEARVEEFKDARTVGDVEREIRRLITAE
ncbi:MAG: acyl carrier protein [Gammaproteobacteria bacterium]